jgi:microsomal dipeptidase-like Zn-dependent dipeptidase
MQSNPIRRRDPLVFCSQGQAAWKLLIIFLITMAIPSRPTAAQVATKFNQIDFTIQTGSDDLRKSSSAIATLHNLHGEKMDEVELKGHNHGSWDNNSTSKVSGALKRPLTATEIGRIVIELQEHNGLGQSDDNWNVQSVLVGLSNKGHDETPIMFFSGDPLIRLTGKSRNFAIPWNARGPKNTYNTITFTVHTGGDDLRGDSSATVALMTANSSTIDVLTLKDKNGSGWGNNSQYTITLPLKRPETLAAIQHVAITLQSHDKVGETPDNWNVQAVQVALSNDGVFVHPLMTESGDPLQRLTQSLPTLVMDSPLFHRNVLGPQKGPGRLRGFVDLHTHPMTNLAFGGKLFYGGVDVGSKLPADPDCHHNVRAKCMQQALGHDASTHGPPLNEATHPTHLDFSHLNPCGDLIRWQVIHVVQQQKTNVSSFDPSDDARGAPDFHEWPDYRDFTHQKMWVEWIRRSYEGGLRVIVALAVNNKTLADMTAGPGDGPNDDRASADLQLAELKAFVARHHDFMGIAYSPEDLEKLVRANKLAVVLGVEIDNIGNFNHVSPLTSEAISAEISRLYKEGVRYIFPIHLINNPFGGTATYQDIMNYSNYRETGHWWALRWEPTISYHFGQDSLPVTLMNIAAVVKKLGTQFHPPSYPKPAGGTTGQANSLGLLAHGEFAIREMMRHGMLIDIDHMSALSQTRAIGIAKKAGGYPLNSGHSELLVPPGGSERNMTSANYAEIGKLHGMAGVGTVGVDAQSFVTMYGKVTQAMGKGAIAGFGTDTNGLQPGMPPRRGSAVHYTDAFPKSRLGTRVWDYNSDGVAHYGMLPDFLEDARSLPNGKEVVDHGMMFGADYFLETWKKCEELKSSVPKG